MSSLQQSSIWQNLSGKGYLPWEELIGRCTLITNSLGWLPPPGAFFCPGNNNDQFGEIILKLPT
ncbi:hypothetical protein, partial [Anabaena sp. CA = ATCC 33047]|uniref:hypothetical protein n=1 Tax=Anabaena sp. (strain CA / ATCC 33047) TaxID=52271 RepID=UPI001E34851F